MQIVTLQEVKDVFGVTFSSRDAYWTMLTNTVEAAILQRIGQASIDTFRAEFGTEDVPMDVLKMAVFLGVGIKNENIANDLWRAAAMVNALTMFYTPAISGGTTA